jgi:hypothetical protein
MPGKDKKEPAIIGRLFRCRYREKSVLRKPEGGRFSEYFVSIAEF